MNDLKLQPCHCGIKGCNPHPALSAKINTTLTPVIWVLGGPQSGKTTQCEKIVERYEVTYLNPKELLLMEATSGSDRASIVSKFMDKHELVPADIVADLLRNAMVPVSFDTRGFVIDEFPREKMQITTFHSVAAVRAVLYFELSEEKLAENYLKGVNQKNMSPTQITAATTEAKEKGAAYLESVGKLLRQCPCPVHIDASKTIDEVFIEVAKVLDPIFVKPPYVTPLTV